MSEKVIVIGAGVGGLSGAIRLARMGYQVEVFEKNKTPGGKMGRLQFNGFTFDTGPTLVTMPFVIKELFSCAGYDITDFLELQPIEPVCRYFFDNGTPFDASADKTIMQQQLEQDFPAEIENYWRFLKYAERIYQNTAPVFIFSPMHELRKMLRWQNLSRLLTVHQIDPFRTVHRAVSRFFRDPRLVQLFDRYPTYNGSDPFRAPATLNVIPWVELGLGGYYIKGGLYQLIAAMMELAGKLGVRLHTNMPVERILHNGRRVTGVQVQGEKIESRIVLCNNDVVNTFTDLIDGFPRTTARLQRLEPSLSGIIFYWGVRGNYPQLKQHNILFSENYRQEFHQLFRECVPPDDPTMYISVSSKTDATHAPAGTENWMVLVNMPYLRDGMAWDAAQIEHVRQAVLRRLQKSGITPAPQLECEQVITPQDLAVRFNSNQGSIYGISSNTMSSTFTRPPNRNRRLRGLYFAGGSTHPGGGVPMCLLSGKMSAELIAEYHGSKH